MTYIVFRGRCTLSDVAAVQGSIHVWLMYLHDRTICHATPVELLSDVAAGCGGTFEGLHQSQEAAVGVGLQCDPYNSS